MEIEVERGWPHDHLGTLPPSDQALIREEYRMRMAEQREALTAQPPPTVT
jgi:hypothetical protein